VQHFFEEKKSCESFPIASCANLYTKWSNKGHITKLSFQNKYSLQFGILSGQHADNLLAAAGWHHLINL